MDNSAVRNILENILTENLIFENESMGKHTTFRTGGNATFYVTPENEEQIVALANELKGIPHMFMGNGSNLLFTDGGYDGVVIEIGSKFSKITVEDNCIIAESGALLSKVANVALEHGLGGMEFAAGIPGSIGGAVAMNAGAYGGEMKDIVTLSTCVGESGIVLEIEDHEFSYRHSIFSDRPLVVLKTVLKLHPKNKEEIKAEMLELNKRRKEKQPLEYPSAGSTFKRPEGYFAGKLIQDAGLKGYKIGGASVSEKHSGFIVSDGTATCDDVLALIEYIQNEVYNKFNVKLEPEVRYIK